MCGNTDLPWNWPSADVCDKCARPHIITRPGRKSHAVFGYTHEGLALTYCGIRWAMRNPAGKEPHCKNCTKELRKAKMSWKWYVSQDREAPNSKL